VVFCVFHFISLIFPLGFGLNCSDSVKGRRGCDRMLVGFTTTYAISAYHHWCCDFESRSGRGVQHYVIKFVSDLQHLSVTSVHGRLPNRPLHSMTYRNLLSRCLFQKKMTTFKSTTKETKLKRTC